MADRPRLKTPFDSAPAQAGQSEPEDITPAAKGPRKRFLFSTRVFFGLTFVLAVAAAGFGGMNNHGDNHAYYVVFTLMTPLVALLVAGIAHTLMRRFRRPPTDDRGPFDS